MVVLVIVLAVVAAAAIVIAIVLGSRLRAQRALTESATATLVTTTAERDAAVNDRDAATAQATEAEAARDEAMTAAEQALNDADSAEAARQDAEARAAEAAGRSGLDPQLLWSLEQARSERTWRQSVAVAEGGSFLDGADDPLREAIQVELDAAREDVGADVALDAALPPNLGAAGSMLVLRAAQELLARSVKLAEEATLRVRVDGDDVLVTIDATDEDGQPVGVAALGLPPSADMAPIDGGVRVRHAAAAAAADAADAGAETPLGDHA